MLAFLHLDTNFIEHNVMEYVEFCVVILWKVLLNLSFDERKQHTTHIPKHKAHANRTVYLLVVKKRMCHNGTIQIGFNYFGQLSNLSKY